MPRGIAGALLILLLLNAAAVATEPPRPLFHASFDEGEHEGVVGKAGLDFITDADGKIDLDRGTFAFFAKRTKAEFDRWWTRPTYPAGDRHGFRRIAGVAQGLGEGYYFQGMGFETWTDELTFLFIDAGRLSPAVRLGAFDDWAVDTWRHHAVVWDRNEGITLYIDGKRAWSNWGEYQWQWNVYPRAIFLNGIGDELYVYADCLTDAQVAQLTAGKTPTGAPLAIGSTDRRRDNELTRYGWLPAQRDALPRVNADGALAIDFAAIERMHEWNRPQAQPRDGLVSTTWPQIYYGPAIKGQKLQVDFAKGVTCNHISALIQRPFDGTLKTDDGAVPLQTEIATIWRHRFDAPAPMEHVDLLRKQGQLGRLDFYHARSIDPSAARSVDQAYHLGPGAFPDSHLGRVVATETPVRFHQPIAMQADAPEAWSLAAPAFGGFQAFAPPPTDARAFDGVIVTLVAEKMTTPTPVRIVVKEPVHSQKDWLVADAMLVPQGDGRQTFTLAIKGRPVINLPPMRVRPFKSEDDFQPVPGIAFGLTVTAGEPVTWTMGGGGSRVTFTTTDMDEALPIAADDQVEFMRQGFATVMEGHLYDDPRIQTPLLWLAHFAPQRIEFKQMARRARLRTEFEGYTPPGDETHPQPANPWNAPDWALWQREVMQEIRDYVDWRIDTMQLPTGEFGSSFNDDSIQAEGWFNYALCMDDSGKIADALRRFHAGLWRYGLDRGVSRYITDAGHASEEGSSSIAMAMMLDYGDPLTYERTLAAASHYDKWLRKTDNGYRAISSYVGAPGAWTEGEFPQAYGNAVHQLMVPAGYLIWYNRHPKSWRYLEGVLGEYPKKQGRMTEFFAGARDWYTGNEVVDPGINPKAKKRPYEPRDRPFRPYRSRGADDEPLWQNWRNSGDDRYLVDLYKGTVGWFDNFDWLITEAMPALDRISEPTAGFAATRMGAKASDRGSAYLVWPEYAVTYTAGADDVAAIVTENRTDAVAIKLFPFTDQAHHTQLRLWRLHPGMYQLTLTGPDDQPIAQRKIDLIRGTFVDLTLPPQQISTLNITAIETHAPDFTKPDPAISLDTVEVVYARHLIVKVHNLGTLPAESVTVRVRDARTNAVIPRGEQTIERIAPALDFQPSYQAVQFDDIYAITRGIIVEVESETPDLNPWNNRVELTDANILGPDYIGIERRARD